jgi:hypothetical protein
MKRRKKVISKAKVMRGDSRVSEKREREIKQTTLTKNPIFFSHSRQTMDNNGQGNEMKWPNEKHIKLTRYLSISFSIHSLYQKLTKKTTT